MLSTNLGQPVRPPKSNYPADRGSEEPQGGGTAGDAEKESLEDLAAQCEQLGCLPEGVTAEDFRRTDDKAAEDACEEEAKAEARAPGECDSGVDEGAKEVRPPAPPKQGGAGEAVPPADGEYPGGNVVVLTQPGSAGSNHASPALTMAGKMWRFWK